MFFSVSKIFQTLSFKTIIKEKVLYGIFLQVSVHDRSTLFGATQLTYVL